MKDRAAKMEDTITYEYEVDRVVDHLVVSTDYCINKDRVMMLVNSVVPAMDSNDRLIIRRLSD